MPYSIDKSQELIKVTYWGSLTEDDVRGVIKSSVDNGVMDFLDRIEDMRKLQTVDTGFDEFINLTKTLRTLQLPRTIKTAILTNNSLQFGVARMFQTMLDHPQMKIEIFTNEDEATKWLSEGK